MVGQARRAVRCMFDPWGEVRVNARRVVSDLNLESLRALLSSLDGVNEVDGAMEVRTDDATALDDLSALCSKFDVDVEERAALNAHETFWEDSFTEWRNVVLSVRSAVEDVWDGSVGWRVDVDDGSAEVVSYGCDVVDLLMHRVIMMIVMMMMMMAR